MLKNISFLALAGTLTFAVSITGCIVVTDDTSDAGDSTTGDGDGDGDPTGDGDGDGDATGDGDGDATGDGDGDATGDGDGDATGDGDGDPTGGGMCGWNETAMYYECGFEGEDPSGTNPVACPDGLVDGDPCGTVTGIGCCDGDGNNWYCGEDNEGNQYLVMNAC